MPKIRKKTKKDSTKNVKIKSKRKYGVKKTKFYQK